MKPLLILALLLTPVLASAQVKFSYNNEEISKIIEGYSKISKQKFIIDPGVRGKATITASDDVSVEEAFNLLSSALALNGYGISKQGDVMTVRNARNLSRDLIETHTTLPALKPERMVTYIFTLKNIPASQVNRELRILPSKDGEMSIYDARNQIIMSDWVSNIHRVDALMKQIDQPLDPKLAKVIEEGRKASEHQARLAKDRGDHPHFGPNSPGGTKAPPPGLPEPRTKRLTLDPPAGGQ